MRKDNFNSSLNYSNITQIKQAAIKGLLSYYNDPNNKMPYTTVYKTEKYWNLVGYSLRYTAISHIGISKWLAYHPQDENQLPELWSRILNELPKINDIGDISLCLWAGCEGTLDRLIELILDKFISIWREQKDKCNSVELGWVLKACLMVCDVMPDSSQKVDSILKDSYVRLSNNYNPMAHLFCRHKRKGFKQKVSGQIACFADQVYPIVAMSHYGKRFDDKKAKMMAAEVVDKICEYQGRQGQWMWHYDVTHNRLCEEYPVFSVHQHAMAPMAIFASDQVNGQNHRQQIALGLKWLFGNNELGENLVLPEQGIIWRDIERDEPEKWSRNVKGLCYTYGLKQLGDFLTEKHSEKFKINYECRPYELGWILYAWADKFKYEVDQSINE